MRIRSTYRDSAKEQFEMEVIGEGFDSEFHQPCYFCRFLPKWQPLFQKGFEVHEIRKCLIKKEGQSNDDCLYKIIDEPKHVQLTLF